MIRTQFDGYQNTADWNHELVQLRRTATRKRLLIHIPVLTAMVRDLARTHHPATDKIRLLRSELIEEFGLIGRASSVAASPYIYAKLLLEKRRYFKALRDRRALEPRCLLTHYGHFEHTYPSVVPTPGRTPSSIAIARPQPTAPRASPEREFLTPPLQPQVSRTPSISSQPTA
jgi:hypothetical protein